MNDKTELECMNKSNCENLLIHCIGPENCSFLSHSKNHTSKILKIGQIFVLCQNFKIHLRNKYSHRKCEFLRATSQYLKKCYFA